MYDVYRFVCGLQCVACWVLVNVLCLLCVASCLLFASCCLLTSVLIDG